MAMLVYRRVGLFFFKSKSRFLGQHVSFVREGEFGRERFLELLSPRFRETHISCVFVSANKTRWWFQIFFMFTPIWGRFPF